MATTIYGNIGSPVNRNEPKSIKKLKKGLNFPFGSRMGGGFFPYETGVSLIKNNISQLLRTERGERVMLPKFGANLNKFLFAPLDEVTFDAIKEEVLTSISRYTDGITVTRIKVIEDTKISNQDIGAIIITLDLRIKELNNSLVEVQVKI